MAKGGENMTTNKNTHTTNSTMSKDTKQATQKVKHTINKVAKKAGTKGGAQMMGTAAGVVVGAAVGGILGAAATDKNTRDKLTQFSKTAVDAAEKLSAKATELSEGTDHATKQLAGDVKDLKKETQRN